MNKIAIASISNENVDEHFGHAKYWQIYEKTDGKYQFLEQRITNAYCKGNCENGFEHITSKLSDCDGIFVAKIGPSAAAAMTQKNIRVFECGAYTPVEDLLAEISGEYSP
jgi:predicted Fe-Mo cluster-binding NifX family protein